MKEKKMAKKMGKTVCKRKITKKTIVMAAAITTISAFAINAIRKPKSEGSACGCNQEEKSEFEIVLDGLVENGTINKDQHVIIQTAIVSAIQASMEADCLKRGVSLEGACDTYSKIIDKLTKFKESLFNRYLF